MAYINPDILDDGLNVATSTGDTLHICSSEPTTHAAALTASLGNSAVTVGAPGARTGGGRKVTVAAVAGGSVTADGTATHYALLDSTGTRLLAANTLTASQVVSNGNTFSAQAFDIGIPNPV